MATSIKKQNPSDIGEYLRDLLKCPVCLETIKSVPVYQCANGHVICKDCIEKSNNCPICRNDSAPIRSLQLEKTVQRLEGIQPENVGPTAPKPNLPKWGKGLSVRSYGAINGPNQVTTPRHATPRHATPRHTSTGPATTRLGIPILAMAMPRRARTRQAMPRQTTIMINNQDVGPALHGHQTENNLKGAFLFFFGVFCVFVMFLFVLCIGHKKIVE
jgi:hypothetical protein